MTLQNPTLHKTNRRQYRAWSVRTVVIKLSRKLTATYRIRYERSLSRLLATLLAATSTWSIAELPTGLNVVAGQASASTPTASNMRIHQATDKAVLNWQTFNIGVGKSVQFVQPAATSVALNRIVGNEASSIYGSLSANGQVFLVNPSGVMFAPGAQVNVGGLVASSLGISNDDFMAGRYTFSGLGGGAVENNGTINAARGGYVLLAAPKVTNTGAITADVGSVGLLAGSRVTLDTSGMGLVRFSVDAAAANAAIKSSGSITARGGQVAVLASAMGDAMATVINQTGVIRADSAVERNGMIVLSGGQAGVVNVAGTLSAAGLESGQTGGTVHVIGDKVLLAPGATVDASGQSGGGTVLVGGDYQGNNASVQNASRLHVAAGTNLSADAISSGNGGKVVLWADGDTRFAGNISARGGAQGGDGGFVEVSGKRDLDVQGRIDVAAPQGAGGKVLLDPENIVLSAAANNPGPVTNQPVNTPDLAFGDAPVPGTYTVNIGSVTGFAELYLQASNDITVNAALTMNAGNSIRLEANNNINVNANVGVTGAGNINFRADADNSGAGNVALTNAALSSQAGGITLRGAAVTGNAASTIITTGAANADGGNVSITGAAGGINLAGAITANGGTTTSVGRNAGNVTVTADGAITTAAITASGTAGAAGANNGGNAGIISVTNNATSAGAVTTGALTAQSGNATGTGLGGAAGSISVTNNATGQNLTTAALSTEGGAGGNGGLITLSSQAGVTATTINTSGTALAAGTRAGSNAGNVTIAGVNRSITGAITANVSAANGTNQVGGNAGAVSITGAGTLGTVGINAQTGAATGTGTGGTVGSITLTGSNATVGALSTAGNANGNGGAVSITTTGTLGVGTIATGGGAATGIAGRNAGAITLSAVGITAVGNITASGGTGSTVNISSTNGIAIAPANSITASGGSGGTGNANGGNAGSITVTNSTAGNIVTGALTAQTGAAVGAGAGGAASTITVTNNAAGQNVTTAALLTTGGAKGAGGNITVSAAGTGTVITNGTAMTATGGAGINSIGANAGNITLSGGTVTLGASALTATGGAGNGTSFAGGSGGTISVTSNTGGMTSTGAGIMTANGGLASATAAAGGAAGFITVTNAAASTGAISLAGTGGLNARTGASTGAIAAGAAGIITVNNNATAATATTLGPLSTAGNANGNGGEVSITTTGTLGVGTIATGGGAGTAGQAGRTGGAVSLRSTGANVTVAAITTTGGNGGAGLTSGGNAGTITLDAGGATPTITLAGNLTALGGNQVGGGTSGAGANIRVQQNVLLNAATVTVDSRGGNAGVGVGGNTQFDGTVNSTGGARALVIQAGSGDATITGATGATSALSALTVTANDIAIGAIGGGAAGVTGATALTATTAGADVGQVTLNGALNVNALTLNAAASINQTSAVRATTLASTLLGTGSALNFGAVANQITSLGTIVTPGGFTLNNGNNNVTGAGNLTTTNNAVSIDAGTGAYTQNANIDISAGTGPITLTANTVAIAANTGNNALTTSGTLTLKPKTAGQAMSLAGASAFDISAAELTAIATGATGPIVVGDAASTGVLTIGAAVGLAGKTLTLNAGSITDTGVQTITAQNVTLNANGQIGTSAANGIDIAATNLAVNTTANANAFVRTGAINLGTGGSSLGSGTLDLTATGNVTQTASTGNITAGTLRVKSLSAGAANITLNNSGNDVAAVNLQARNAGDTANASGAIQYTDATGFDVAALATTGNATLSAGGVVTQSGAVAATGLALTGAGGAYTLNNAGNAITTLAANTGSVDYKQAGALIVGTVGTAGVTTSGVARIETTGAASNLTLNNAVTSTATGNAVILKAGSANAAGVSTGGQFINNVGAAGIVAASGRYLVYSGDPGSTTEGMTGYGKRYNSDLNAVPATAASTFLYRIAPTLTVTANNNTRVYGDSNPALTGVVNSGLIDGDTAASVGVNFVTTAVARTAVAAGPVAITVAATNNENYTLATTNGALTITRRDLTVSATGQDRVSMAAHWPMWF